MYSSLLPLAVALLVLSQIVVGQNGTISTSSPSITIATTLRPTTPTILPTADPTIPFCVEEDFGYTFGECDTQTNTMLVVNFKKSQCTGDVPASTQRVPCDIKCNNGEVLTAPTTVCRKCPSGHFSFSEGTNIVDWNAQKRNPNLKTFCVGNKCKEGSGWTIHKSGNYIHSGNDQPDDIKSILVYWFEIVRESGSIEFTFKVDAERDQDQETDGLEFWMDDEKKMSRTSFVNEYTTRRYENLSKGFHKVEWKYVKNNALSRGKDRAQINNIKVYGTRFHETHCTPCKAGTYTEYEGSESCLPCPMFTYANASGTATCIACPANQYSLEGSTECILRPNCTIDDFMRYYTPCENGHRILHYEPKQPIICSLETMDTSARPTDQPGLPCAPCPDGQYREANTYQCTKCPGTAQYYDSISRKCQTCGAGEAAIKFARYDHNYFAETRQLPSDWKVKCHGSCPRESKGWFIATDRKTLESYLQSGGIEGLGEAATLAFNVQLYTNGRVSFDYELVQNRTEFIDEEGATLSFYVDNNVKGFFDKNSGPNKNGYGIYTSPYISPGNHTLLWVFEKYDSYDPEATLIIRNITIEGDQSGAADRCLDCPAGFKCDANSDRFLPCPPGQFSKYRSNTCNQCPPGTYNDEYARAHSCPKCPSGTHSSTFGATDCNNECQYHVPGTQIYYDLKDLEAAATLEYNSFGPIFVVCFKGNFSDMKLFFNLCNRFHNNASFCNTQRIGLGQSKNQYEKSSTLSNSLISYACLQYQELSFDMGHIISFSPPLFSETSSIADDETVDPDKRGDGLRVELISKEMCVAPLNDDEDPTDIEQRIINADRPFRTIIDFICNPKAGRGRPMLREGPDSFQSLFAACDINLQWETISACPICVKYDYDEILGQCQEDGYRHTTYYPKLDSRCNPFGRLPDGVDKLDILPPVNRTGKYIKCPVCTMEDVEVVDTKCHEGVYTRRYMWRYPKNCTEMLTSFHLPDPEQRACEDVDIPRMTALIIVTLAIMIFSGMVIGYVLLYRRHQQLYRNYQILQQTESKELNDFELFAEGSDIDSQDEDMGFNNGSKSSKKKFVRNKKHTSKELDDSDYEEEEESRV